MAQSYDDVFAVLDDCDQAAEVHILPSTNGELVEAYVCRIYGDYGSCQAIASNRLEALADAITQYTAMRWHRRLQAFYWKQGEDKVLIADWGDPVKVHAAAQAYIQAHELNLVWNGRAQYTGGQYVPPGGLPGHFLEEQVLVEQSDTE